MNFLVEGKWTSFNKLTGIELGKSVVIQNTGRPGDLIECISSASKPSDSDRGIAFGQISPTYRINGSGKEVWVRYIRYDINGTIIPKGDRKCLISVETEEEISEYTGKTQENLIKIMLSGLNPVFSSIIDSNYAIMSQLKLLNARVEEGFQTQVNIEDIDNAD